MWLHHHTQGQTGPVKTHTQLAAGTGAEAAARAQPEFTPWLYTVSEEGLIPHIDPGSVPSLARGICIGTNERNYDLLYNLLTL